jgi:periodic tryptophan protein 1
MSMITATAWVPRGYAATFPTKYKVDEHELARISNLAKLNLNDANEELQQAKESNKNGISEEDGSDDEQNGVKLSKPPMSFL